MNKLFGSVAQAIVALFLLITWIAGVVIAKGFWSAFIGCVFPFWSWYLVVEKVMIHLNLI